MLSGWEFFRIYYSLKLHFSSVKYDVLKYGGSTKYAPEAFAVRNDRMRFDHFANKLMNKTKAGNFCIANFMYGTDQFVYNNYDDAYDVYLEWLKVKESLTREFEKDVLYLSQLATSRPGLDLFAKTKSGQLPPLLQVSLANKINVETLVILNKEHKEFFDMWAKDMYNDPYVMQNLLKWKKYQPFIQYDADKIKTVLEGAEF